MVGGYVYQLYSYSYLAKSVYQKIVSYFSTKTYVVGTQNNRLNETFFERPKHLLKTDGKKIFTILHSKKYVYLNLWLYNHFFCSAFLILIFSFNQYENQIAQAGKTCATKIVTDHTTLKTFSHYILIHLSVGLCAHLGAFFFVFPYIFKPPGWIFTFMSTSMRGPQSKGFQHPASRSKS